MNTFEYVSVQKINDIFEHLQTSASVLKAGGVDLMDLMKEGLATPSRLINIRDIAELEFIRDEKDRGIIIGPTKTLRQLSQEKLLQGNFQALAQAAGSAALPQIRNMATLGGNLCQRPRCWYFRNAGFHCLRKGGDTCFALDGENQYHAILGNQDGCVIVHPSATAVALTALDAKLTVFNGKSSREIEISKFYVTPAEDITRETILKSNDLITEVIIPQSMKSYKTFYMKQREKQSFDWPIADAAVALRLNGTQCSDARIVLGAAAPVPWIAAEAAAVLKGKKISKDLARQAAEVALSGAEPLSENEYKIPVAKTIVFRTICRAAGLDPMV